MRLLALVRHSAGATSRRSPADLPPISRDLLRSPTSCASSGTQLETPSLVEDWFGGEHDLAAAARRKAEEQGKAGGLVAQIMGRLDALVGDRGEPSAAAEDSRGVV